MNHVSKKARIGRNVKIGGHSIVHDNVSIADDVTIGNYCEIGVPAGDVAELSIGRHSLIRSFTVIYQGSELGAELMTGHHVLIRDRTKSGENLQVGSFSDVEGDCTFGDYVRCHSYVHVGRGSVIGSFVWLYSQTTLTNDPLPPSTIEDPVRLEDGVVVGVGSIVFPGSIMKVGSYATAGCHVRGTIPKGRIASGETCEIRGHVSSLMHLGTMTRHPWMSHHADRYPHRARPRLAALCTSIRSRKDE